MFGGRRAVVLKSHGFDLLQEKGQRRNAGELGRQWGGGKWASVVSHLGLAWHLFSICVPT